ncbi:thiol peroxidase [Marinagarivorans algicola]|uniref:thiol peroxidase n=1 Tax=Marinagarivorans algicola TaxID=1513270 RepID=UPI0006B5B324|nr:thiol peroxidase [Marinagarivorans algicola]
MAKTALKGNPVNTNSDLPSVGSQAPMFSLTKVDLSELSSSELQGKRVILNVFPSVDTPTCAQSVRTFNEEVSHLANTVVLCISQDLPFALARFCGAEGLDNVVSASAFRSSFAEDFGLKLLESPLAGLTARAVIVLDEKGSVLHAELVSEIAEEPNYEAAKAVL